MDVTKIDLAFNNSSEVLNVINTGGEIVSKLSDFSGKCHLLGSEIEFGEELGRGTYGIAFSIKIKGKGPKEYVVKKMRAESLLEDARLQKPVKLIYVAKSIENTMLISSSAVIAVNGGDPHKIIYPNSEGMGEIFLPQYANICMLEKPLKVERLDGSGGEVIYPKGSYLCENNQYSEYVIGVLCGELYRSGVSVNFIDVFDFITCPEEETPTQKVASQYVFMEKIDSSYEKWMKCINSGLSENVIVEVFYIQILHSIAVYQKYYKLQHNDLHAGNVFIENIKQNTEFNGQRIDDCEWFHYKIDEVDLYLPYIPILAKIGDFGLSVKYSTPIVGDRTSIEIGYDQEDGEGPWVPNWYTENYDSIMITYILHVKNINNTFIENILLEMLNRPKGKFIPKYFSHGIRPMLSMLHTFKNASPSHILKNKKLMGRYMKKPKTGKIVTLGSI